MLTLAIPSNGALHEPSLQFLESCGIGVVREGARKYTGEIPAIPDLTVHFQRASDITGTVEVGRADLGIVGRDRFIESQVDEGNTVILLEGLGFGRSELVFGIPDSWIDVTSLADILDLSLEFRKQGSDIRIATKYPRSVERFLLHNGINYFYLTYSSGTLEAAPAMGHADIIADITSTGSTMRENSLKTILGGSIMKSEACLIGNTYLIKQNSSKIEQAADFVGRVEARLQAIGM